MIIAKIDSQRRLYLPKSLGISEKKVIIIPIGRAYLMIPVPEKAIEIDVKKDSHELLKLADKRAKEDVISRARRRGQL
ncbi:MAG: hypothetical protein ACTSXJ_10450 [Candidatus Baldrarchaeia archaeon]